MAKYKLRKNSLHDDSGNVISTFEDILDQEATPNLAIPKTESNRHYQEYLEWVAEGNTAEAAD